MLNLRNRLCRWKISRIWSAGNCKKLTPTLAQSHDPFIITYN